MRYMQNEFSVQNDCNLDGIVTLFGCFIFHISTMCQPVSLFLQMCLENIKIVLKTREHMATHRTLFYTRITIGWKMWQKTKCDRRSVDK